MSTSDVIKAYFLDREEKAQLVGIIRGLEMQLNAKPKRNFERFRNDLEAADYISTHECGANGHIMSFTWANIRWLYMEYIEGESRLDYLKRCKGAGILNATGYKEIQKLEKEAAK